MKRKLLGTSLLAALLLGALTACGQPGEDTTAPGASPVLPGDTGTGGTTASPPADGLGLPSPSPATTE